MWYEQQAHVDQFCDWLQSKNLLETTEELRDFFNAPEEWQNEYDLYELSGCQLASKIAKRLGQDVHVGTFRDGPGTFLVIYRTDQADEVLEAMLCWARNQEVPFSRHDAARFHGNLFDSALPETAPELWKHRFDSMI